MLDRLWLPIAGFIDLPGNESTAYTFSLESDDGSLVFIDGMKVAADPGARVPALNPNPSPKPNPACDADWFQEGHGGLRHGRRTALAASQSVSAYSAECACIAPGPAHHAVQCVALQPPAEVGSCPLPASEQQQVLAATGSCST